MSDRRGLGSVRVAVPEEFTVEASGIHCTRSAEVSREYPAPVSPRTWTSNDLFARLAMMAIRLDASARLLPATVLLAPSNEAIPANSTGPDALDGGTTP